MPASDDFPPHDIPGEDEGEEAQIEGSPSEEAAEDADQGPSVERFRRLVGEEGDESAVVGEDTEDHPDPDDVRRHPTGEPELTGGWFMQEDEEGAVPEAEEPIKRHPTGDPELTGGWFGQEGAAAESAVPAEAPQGTQEDTEGEQTVVHRRPEPEETADRRTPTPPPPELGTTPQRTRPALGTGGMPLPRRVDEIDMDATRVSPSAVDAARARGGTIPPYKPPAARRPGRRAEAARRSFGCIVRMVILGLFAVVLLALAFGSFALYQYYQIAATLPSVDDLRLRASQFETTRILDRNGNTLYEILDPTAGRRTYVPLERVSPFMIAATVATEDKDFFSNPGFDPLAIVRAFGQNFQSGETVSGASTITQQLASALLFSPEERSRSQLHAQGPRSASGSRNHAPLHKRRDPRVVPE